MTSDQLGRNPALSVFAQSMSAQRRVGPFMLVAIFSLLLGLWAGLARMGWDMPGADSALMLRHGGLMVMGFIVTVIAVERAVAVRSLPAFAAPALSAATGVVLTAGVDGKVAPALAAAAGAAFSLNVGILLYRHRTLPFVVAMPAALCLLVAGIVWLDGGGISRVVPFWIAFLVLTIAAERLDILRFQTFTPVAVAAGIGSIVLILTGPVVSLADSDSGARVLGFGLILAAGWLLRRDVALHTVRTDGLARFAAAGILFAYGWLATGGLLLLLWGLGSSSLQYDAVIHAFFIGFVFSAIMAHEPIIAPAVTGLPFSYTPLLYAPLAVLNSGLVLRIIADVAEASGGRRWAGMIQAIAILVFLGLSAGSVLLSRRRKTRGHAYVT